ncbi:MAG TPA: hypothetical protein VFZ59_15070 [Verrucomicrobiae bacterium]|nr:hypothetical protein [Verrucomicrobiae bacterium]
MKKGIIIVLAAVALSVAGCVSKVTQDNPGRAPAYRDRIEAQYKQPAEKVFEAAKRAFNSFGNITRESSPASGAAQLWFIEGLINGNRVYLRIEGTAATSTRMTVQVRAPGGGTNLVIANELHRQTEIEFTRR